MEIGDINSIQSSTDLSMEIWSANIISIVHVSCVLCHYNTLAAFNIYTQLTMNL